MPQFAFGDTPQTYWQRASLMSSLSQGATDVPAHFEDMLEAYYMNNGLYDALQQYLADENLWSPSMKPLYNPANRAVEFHVSHLWPGPLDRAFRVMSDDQKVIDAIGKVLTWSNWAAKKELAARWFALFGTMFIKVPSSRALKKVWHQTIKPQRVTDFDVDNRDYITYIRIDTVKSRINENTNIPETYMLTEVWSKKDNSYRLFEHKKDRTTPISQLGTPKESSKITDFGFDFIPIVHAKFKDAGEPRGVGVFTLELDKIDEANRIATRLHEIAFRFNRPYIAVGSNDRDSAGRPLPAPRLADRNGNDITSADELTDDESLVRLPGMTSLEMMVPKIDFDGHLKILNDQMDELKQDLPELRYYDIKKPEGISTETMRMMLSNAIDRALEARGNAQTALIRANQMALTIGKSRGFDGFADLGEYESGGLDHAFAEQEVIPLSPKERAEAVGVAVTAGMDILFAMRKQGYTAEEVNEYAHSTEYLVRMQEKANDTGIAVETLLMRSGWTEAELKEFGTQKLAAIALQQEDIIPEDGQ